SAPEKLLNVPHSWTTSPVCSPARGAGAGAAAKAPAAAQAAATPTAQRVAPIVRPPHQERDSHRGGPCRPTWCQRTAAPEGRENCLSLLLSPLLLRTESAGTRGRGPSRARLPAGVAAAVQLFLQGVDLDRPGHEV